MCDSTYLAPLKIFKYRSQNGPNPTKSVSKQCLYLWQLCSGGSLQRCANSIGKGRLFKRPWHSVPGHWGFVFSIFTGNSIRLHPLRPAIGFVSNSGAEGGGTAEGQENHGGSDAEGWAELLPSLQNWFLDTSCFWTVHVVLDWFSLANLCSVHVACKGNSSSSSLWVDNCTKSALF